MNAEVRLGERPGSSAISDAAVALASAGMSSPAVDRVMADPRIGGCGPRPSEVGSLMPSNRASDGPRAGSSASDGAASGTPYCPNLCQVDKRLSFLVQHPVERRQGKGVPKSVGQSGGVFFRRSPSARPPTDGELMTTPTDNPAARHQAHLETLENIADQVGAFELAVARMANARWTSQKRRSCSDGPGTGSATCARCCTRLDVTSSTRETSMASSVIAAQHAASVGTGTSGPKPSPSRRDIPPRGP